MRLGATPGMIRWRLATGRWEELYPGVYCLAGVPQSWRQQLLGACVSFGSDAVASHRAAGRLSQLAGIECRVFEISVPRWKRRHRRGIVIHEAVLEPVDLAIVDAIPVTTVTRTLIDLGAVVPADALEEALDDALRRSLTTISRLRWRLGALATRGRPGVAAIRSLLDDRDPAAVTPKSVLETRFARLARRAGLPAPVRQLEVRENGRLIGRVDFAYPDHMLAIEVDGYRWHSGRRAWQRDLARRNRVTERGWRVIHVTDRDLEEGAEELVRTVARALVGSPPR